VTPSARLIQPPMARARSDTDNARLLPRDPRIGPGLRDHLALHGELPRGLGSTQWRGRVMGEIERSGLVGRGGAAFPTAKKLLAVTFQPGRAVVIANGTEGEPASEKDRALLARAPHLVLDGAAVAADLVAAGEAIIVVHRDVRGTVDRALEERRAARIDRTQFRVVTAADRFVAGEASAVVNWVARGKPVPMAKPPRLAERGLGDRPTLVQNVETLANLALIARLGATWYRTLGTSEEPGSMLVTILGAIGTPGVLEVEIGTPVSNLLEQAGGLTGPIQALLVGGYFGRWLPAEVSLRRPFSARGLGIGLGAGLVIALPVSACGVAETARLARYLANESAGQCGPCAFGLPAIANELESLAQGRPTHMAILKRWISEIEGRGACSHPDGVARMIRSALEVFANEVTQHEGGWCTAVDQRRILPTPNGWSS